MRHSGDVRHLVAAHGRGEARVDDRCHQRHDAPPDEQVRVEHRQPVAVVEGQGRDPSVRGGQPEVGGDRRGIAEDVVVRQPDELRRAGRARCAEQQGELRMEHSIGGSRPPHHVQFVAVDVHQSIGGPRRCQLLGVVAGEQWHVVAGEDCQVGRDELDRIRRLEHDERSLRQRQFVLSAFDAGRQLPERDDLVALQQRRCSRRPAGEERRPHPPRVDRQHRGECKGCLSSSARRSPRLASDCPCHIGLLT